MNKLYEARKTAALTAYQLATAAGTREPRIYAFERNRHRPRFDEARQIAEVLQTTPEELFPGGVQAGGAR